jgi:hypothetical protein
MRLEFSTARATAAPGFLFENGATGVISSWVVTDNGFGLRNDEGGTLLSRRNTVTGNTTGTSGTIMVLTGL